MNSLEVAKTCYSKSASTIFLSCINAFHSQYLETLCDLLYDDLRPRILHEPRLTVLCEVCTVLQALMVLDASSTPSTSASTASSDADGSDSSDDDDDTLASTSQDLASNPPSSASQRHHNRVGKRLHISHLLKMVLQDAQTRLFFKAQAVIQSEIRHYVPKAEDLAWPDILVCEFPPNIRSLRVNLFLSPQLRTSL